MRYLRTKPSWVKLLGCTKCRSCAQLNSLTPFRKFTLHRSDHTIRMLEETVLRVLQLTSSGNLVIPAGQMPAVIILWSQLYHILFFLTKLQQPSTHLRVALAAPLNFALIPTWHVCHEKYFTFLSRATTTIMGDPNIFTACNIFAWQWNIFSLLSRPTISRSRSSCSCQSCWRPTRSATRTEQCGEKRRRSTRPRCQYSDPGWMRRTCDNQSLRATITSLLTRTLG